MPNSLVLPDSPLRGSGVLLRGWAKRDAPSLVQAWNDPEIAAWNAVPPQPSLETAVHWISGTAQRLERRVSIDLVIQSDAGGTPGAGCAPGAALGEVGLSGFSEHHRAALIGYWLLPSSRGHGLASAGVEVFVAWAHETLDLDVIVARCHQDNVASQAVAASAGFSHEANDASQHQLWRSSPE